MAGFKNSFVYEPIEGNITMCGNKFYSKNPDVALREEDENGSLLFNPDTGEVLIINDTGRFIWDLCEEEITIKAIVSEFNEAYEDLPENLTDDVEAYVNTMTKGGFIVSR